MFLLYRTDSPKHCDVINAFADILNRKFGCDVTQCLQQVTPDFETRLKKEVNNADYILVVLPDQRKYPSYQPNGELLIPDAFGRYLHGLLDLIGHPDDHPLCTPLRDRVVLIRFPYTPEDSQLISLGYAVRYCVPENMSHLHSHLTKWVTNPVRYSDSWLTEDSGKILLSAVEVLSHGYHSDCINNLSQDRVDLVTPPQHRVQLSYQWETGSSANSAQPLIPGPGSTKLYFSPSSLNSEEFSGPNVQHPQGLWPPAPPSITTADGDETLKSINKNALNAFFGS